LYVLVAENVFSAEKLGTGFLIVKSDINGNVERLSSREQADPAKFQLLFDIVRDDVGRGEDKGSHSVTKGLLWLQRWVDRQYSDNSAMVNRQGGILTCMP
jgi:Glycolipid transfer protein (GLTP)